MSTKASVTIKSHDNAVHVWRNCDGDPPETGYKLAAMLRDSRDFVAAVQQVLTEAPFYEAFHFAPAEGFPGNAQYHYEIDYTDRVAPKWAAEQAPVPTVSVHQKESESGGDWETLFHGDFTAYRRFINLQVEDAPSPALEAGDFEATPEHALYRAREARLTQSWLAGMDTPPDAVEIDRFWVAPDGEAVNFDDATPGRDNTAPRPEFSTIFLHFPERGREAVIDVDDPERAAELAQIIEQEFDLQESARPA